MNRIQLIALVLSGVLSQGCLSFMLKGGEGWGTGVPSQYEAKYQASTCTENGKPDEPIPVNLRYYLVKTATGPGLVELERNEKDGSIFTNTWSDAANDYFFGYVRGSNGYLFTVPKNHSQPATRTVYLTVNVWLVSARAGWGVTTTDTGVMKPKGKVADAWAVTCPLKP